MPDSRPDQPPTDQPRINCLHCHRSLSHCLCDTIPPVANRTGVLVLQHPREHRHKLGTEPLARLGLARFRLEVARGSSDRDLLHPMQVPAGTALLYPGPTATDLAALPATERPANLLLLDGTWSQARRLYTDNPWLADLPHVRFTPSAPSRYRIRREPDVAYLSTIESIVTALRILEPDTAGLDGLLAAFERMVDRQVERAGEQPRWQRPRQRAPRKLPPELFADRLLVITEEFGALDPDADAPERIPHSLLQWIAAEIDERQPFAAIVRPPHGEPSALRLAHAGLSTAHLRDGESTDSLRARFAAFAAGATLAAWSPRSLQLAGSELGWQGPTVLLKAAYANLRGGRRGSLDDILDAEGLHPAPLALPGRAGHRAAAGVAIARWLREHGPALQQRQP